MKRPKGFSSVRLGSIVIQDTDYARKRNSIFLLHDAGEAGQFSRAKLAKVLAKFFDKEF